MSRQTKGRSGCNQATSKASYFKVYFTAKTKGLKALIVTLALWGWLPIGLTDWISHLGDVRDE